MSNEYAFKQARRLQILLSTLIAVSILSVSAIIGMGVYVVQKEKTHSARAVSTAQKVALLAIDTRRITVENRTAVCAFTADLSRRIKATENYIKQVEAGQIHELEAAPVAATKLSVKNQKRTLRAFKTIKCPGEE